VWLAAQPEAGAARGNPARCCTSAALTRADRAADGCADCPCGERSWPHTLASLGGEGDRAEGRTPFAALSAGARGGLRERSDLPTVHLFPSMSGRYAVAAYPQNASAESRTAVCDGWAT